MRKTIIAIDPGSSGGIAYRLAQNERAVADKMPDTEGDVVDHLKHICEASEGPAEIVAFVEQVGGFIQGNPAPGSAMFNFGRNFGFILGCLQMAGVRVELVRPQKWQAAIGIPKSGGEKSEHKRRMKEKAQQLYPECKVTLSTADALLLLEFAKQASN
jgi:crossover junction endodeoxyribonuclease RuvC